MDRNAIIKRALAAPPEAIRRELTTAIRMERPDDYLATVGDIYSEVYRFAAKDHCDLERIPDFDYDINVGVYMGRLSASPEVGWFKIQWQGATLELAQIELSSGYHRSAFAILFAANDEIVHGFLKALDEFTSKVEGAVLVFQDGCWRHDEDLYQDIQASTLDNLVLPPGMANRIRNDIQQWLESKELYEQHGIPWKRGMILVGPPGNGKTHTVKALINHFKLNALYVRGFSSQHGSDSQNISRVFERARACAPSMLILEDLDSLVTPYNRSHFLNEMDGFARNTGILAVASANDPAKLDPALVNRPSRFDRRYAFDLPEVAERARYLTFFTQSLDPNLRLSENDSAAIGAETDGFSFAYLKELVLSGMMAWISADRRESFTNVIGQHVSQLRTQMENDPEPTPMVVKDYDDDDQDEDDDE